MRKRVRRCLREWRWLALLVALALARGALYAAVVPPWQSPDETGHFEYVWLLAHLRRIPAIADASTGFEGQLIDSLYRWRFGEYTGRPLPEEAQGARPERLDELPPSIVVRRARTFPGRFSLGYLVQALATVPLLHKGLEAQLYAARLSSVLLNAWIVAAAYLTFRELFPGRELAAILGAAIVLLSPQHTFINATAGDGTLAEAGAALAIYGWARAFGRRFGALEGVAIAAGTVISNLSKNTAVFLIAVDAVLALWWVGRRLWRGWRWWQAAALAVTVLLLAGGLWIWRDSALGERAAGWLERVAVPPDEWAWVDRRGMTLGEALLTTHDSLWANFGWMNLPLSNRWYGAILGFSVLAWVGWAVRRPGPVGHVSNVTPGVSPGMLSPAPTTSEGPVGHVSNVTPGVSPDTPSPVPTTSERPVGHVPNVTPGASPDMPSPAPTTSEGAGWAAPMALVLVGAALGAYAWVALLGREDGFYQFQGRYLFPAIVPWAYLLAEGAWRVVGGRRGVVHLLMAGLAVLDAWAMVMYVVPYYYG